MKHLRADTATLSPTECSTLVDLLDAPTGLGVIPTDTVYGLVTAWDRPNAIERIYRLKQRDPSKPLALLTHSLKTLSTALPLLLTPQHLDFCHAILPGPFTLLVPLARQPGALHPQLMSPGPVVAFRIPDHPLVFELTEALGRPLASTSANRSGEEPAHDPAHLSPALRNDIDFLVDAGPAAQGTPSTILNLTQPRPTVVREGAVNGAELTNLIHEHYGDPPA